MKAGCQRRWYLKESLQYNFLFCVPQVSITNLYNIFEQWESRNNHYFAQKCIQISVSTLDILAVPDTPDFAMLEYLCRWFSTLALHQMRLFNTIIPLLLIEWQAMLCAEVCNIICTTLTVNIIQIIAR